MARVLGMQHQADLVLWGRYGVTGSDVRLTLHVENLTEAKSLPLPIAKDYATQAVVAELERFQFQERFSKEMSALVLFISGVVRYEAGDYPGAIRRLDSALAAGRWPKGLVAKAALFFYRGNCYLSAGNIQQSMADLTKAIQLAPHYAEAYVNRGYLYNILSKYSKAITDLTYAVHLEPKLVEAYINRGITYAFLRQPYKSIADYTHAIQLDPESKRPFNNRGAIYLFRRVSKGHR
jgi:tetratricopeptide (TPR) repeat protein